MRGFLGLGSNLGDRRALLDAALAALGAAPGVEVRRVARRYRTAALGPAGQEWYLNTVAEIATELAPRKLLERCQTIERSLGRVRRERWGPRTIDLDLLWLDGVQTDDAALTLPHPDAHRRVFVLAPLQELVPDFRFKGRPIAAWLA